MHTESAIQYSRDSTIPHGTKLSEHRDVLILDQKPLSAADTSPGHKPNMSNRRGSLGQSSSKLKSHEIQNKRRSGAKDYGKNPDHAQAIKEGDVYYRTIRTYPSYPDFPEEVYLTVSKPLDHGVAAFQNRNKEASPPTGRQSAESRAERRGSSMREITATPMGDDRDNPHYLSAIAGNAAAGNATHRERDRLDFVSATCTSSSYSSYGISSASEVTVFGPSSLLRWFRAKIYLLLHM